MKNLTLLAFLISGFNVNGFSSETNFVNIKYATIEEANELLTQEDDFTKSWSQFDIDSRMQKTNSTKEELFDYITKQTRAWTQEEQDTMNSIFESINQQIEKQGFKIVFPEEIYFIKTTAEEEGGAEGYTRSSYIVLKDNILTKDKEALKNTIIHELFHVLTRNNPEFRKEMYQIIGFNMMNEVAYPDNLKAYRITNPDAPQVDSYISLKVDGEQKNCMMILYADREYNGGSFFEYLNIGFLSLTGDKKKAIEYKNDKPVIYSFPEVKDFFEQVGKNTQYIIHPEEILAENFVFAILNKLELSDPEIVDMIKKKLIF